uniref:Uncharacterized protein n=1 Tax=Triticum urartu TaxID=4572 RepID=A0A8R7U053_TRIUA
MNYTYWLLHQQTTGETTRATNQMHANIQLKTVSIIPVALVLAWQSGAADRLWITHA